MIELIIKILQRLGIPDEYLNPIVVGLLSLALLGVIASFAWKAIKRIILFRNQEKLNRDLTPYFSRQDVDRATRYFIPTRYQNVSPAEDDEPGRLYIASAQAELIPLFLNKAFKNDGDGNKFYLILADTGMGKTTFIVNLYLQYKNQWKNFSALTKSYDIALFPLGHPDALQEVEKIADKKNTILLLDAFDEDVKALDNHNARMNEILGKVNGFREIVITCRTQFFPSEEEEPHKTGYYSFGESGEYKFQKLYLSVFDNKDVKKYLRKRFSILSANYYKAKRIVEKCPNLVVRPMLLSRIDDLLDSDKTFEFSFQIYEVMIDKWIERESKKRGIREKYGSSENYQKLLYQFSRALALDLYKNKDTRGGYLISKDEKISVYSELQIADIETENKSLTLTEREARSQSLLNRNSKGEYKFSHKSFLEYFLTKEMFENPEFTLDFEGMTAAGNFYEEMLCEELSKVEGYFNAGQKNIHFIELYKSKSLRNLFLIYLQHNLLQELKITKLNNFNPLALSGLTELRSLIIVDTEKFQSLYGFYRHFYLAALLENIKRQEPRERLERRELIELRKLIERLEQMELRERLELQELLELIELLELVELQKRLERRQLRELIELRELPELAKLIELTELREWRERRELIELGEWLEWRERRELTELIELRERRERLKNSDQNLIAESTLINSFLKDMKTLQKRLPNCRMYY